MSEKKDKTITPTAKAKPYKGTKDSSTKEKSKDKPNIPNTKNAGSSAKAKPREPSGSNSNITPAPPASAGKPADHNTDTASVAVITPNASDDTNAQRLTQTNPNIADTASNISLTSTGSKRKSINLDNTTPYKIPKKIIGNVTLPDPSSSDASDWVFKALQTVIPKSIFQSLTDPRAHANSEPNAGNFTGPNLRAPNASHPDPNPYDIDMDNNTNTSPNTSRGIMERREHDRDRPSRSRQRSDEYANSRSWAVRGGERSPSPRGERDREAEISVMGDYDPDFGYHESRHPSNRSQRWREGSTSSRPDSLISQAISIKSSEADRSFAAHSEYSHTPQFTHSHESETTQHNLPGPQPPGPHPDAAEVLIKYCPQLAASEQPTESGKSIFRLNSSLGDTSKGNNSRAIKMDTPYKECYHKLDKQRSQMKISNREVNQNFRIEADDYEKYFTSPSVPDVAFRVGDSYAKNQNTTGGNHLRSRAFRSTEWQLSGIDASARASMRLAMYQGYLATALNESQTLGVSDADKSKISDLMSKVADLQYEQATRTALLCTRVRRENVVEGLKLEKGTAKALLKVPAEGKDLFNGKFQDVLDENITANMTADKTTYKLSKFQPRSKPSYNRSQAPHFRRDKGPSFSREPSSSPRTRHSGSRRAPQAQGSKPWRGNRRHSQGHTQHKESKDPRDTGPHF